MLRFRNQKLFIILSFAVILLAIWVALDRTSLFHSSHHKKLYSDLYPLSGDAKIAQDFMSKYPGLYRIDIYFENRGDESKGEVLFRLKESCDASDDLETFVIPASGIVDGEFQPFVFEPIDNSAYRDFCIVLESDVVDKSDELGVYASWVDTYPEGTAIYREDTILKENDDIFRDDKSEFQNEVTSSPTYNVWLPIIIRSEVDLSNIQSDIGFQLYYNGRILETLKVLLTRLSAHKPYLFGISWFYIFLFVFYWLTIVLFWLLVFKTRFNSKL
jgi:hypothetical protein